MLLAAFLFVPATADLPRVEVRDGLEITRSCVLVCDAPVVDEAGDGVVHVVAAGVEVHFEGELRQELGAPEETPGVGVVVRAEDVTLLSPRLAGFQTGIWATEADGLRIEGGSLREGFRHRLGSTWEREDPADWLRPHANDDGEWRRRYGAAVCVERTDGVTVAGLRVRTHQNGIVLDRVTDAAVLGCDASFLSGWGLAMWRSSKNRVEGNRFDFCVRGYAHGRYNRGQDSAGILLFEQCCDNVFRRNSATHCGDGVFGFAGREALGEGLAQGEAWAPAETGCNRNLFEHNDLSFAAAHGLELTFSRDNVVRENLFEGNAICGVWYGYGRDSRFEGNVFLRNGDAGYGGERGGLNAEHGQRLEIVGNWFGENGLDLRFWTDEDAHLARTPWALHFGQGAGDIHVLDSVSPRASGISIEALELIAPLYRNRDVLSPGSSFFEPAPHDPVEVTTTPGRQAPDPKHLRPHLLNRVEGRAREAIVVDEFGPYDWRQPWIQPLERNVSLHRYRVLGPVRASSLLCEESEADVFESPGGPDGLAHTTIEIQRSTSTLPQEYDISVFIEDEDGVLYAPSLIGFFLPLRWWVRLFAWSEDPREDPDAWREAASQAIANRRDGLDLQFGTDGPEKYGVMGLPSDGFGTSATTTVVLPPGRYRLETLSDDGIRVLVDGEVVIEDWTWHAATSHAAVFELVDYDTVEIVVEHFELDGAAVLSCALECVTEP